MRASSADRQRRRNDAAPGCTKMFSPGGYNRDLHGRPQARTLTATIVQRLVDECPMVAVGTRIAPRPPHRSRRALLTHRAPPSGRTSAANGLNPSAVRRTAANRIDVATRLCVRTTAVCQLFPLGEALPSPTSAGSCLPLFDRFISTMASSDFSSTYTLGV